jgi:HrpA-like RNA helicase
MKIAVSKAEADQAAGRPGRLGTGFYIACSFESEYESLNPFPIPEVLCSPITSTALQLAAMKRNIRTFDMPDKPEAKMIEATMRRLVRLGAIDDKEKITDLGRKLVRFPIDPERAAALLFASTRDVLEEAVVAMAIDENEGIFFRPRHRHKSMILDEQTLQVLLSYYDFSRGTPLERPWILAEHLELTALNLPKWINPKGNEYEVLCGDSSFPHREGQRWVADCLKKGFAGRTGSDFSAGVRAYRAFKEKQRELFSELDSKKEGERGRFRREIADRLRAWCARNCLNYKKAQIVGNTVKLLIEELSEAGLTLSCSPNKERDFDDHQLTKSLIVAFIDGVAVHRPFDGRRAYQSATANFSLAWASACSVRPLIISSNVSKVSLGGSGHVFIADCAASIEEPWLKELLPQMFTSSTAVSLDPWTGNVRAYATTQFANICLSQTEIDTTPAQVRRAIAEAIEEGTVSSRTHQRLEMVSSRNAEHVRKKGKKKWAYHAKEERIRFYQQQLNGITCLNDIQNPDKLLLPGA